MLDSGLTQTDGNAQTAPKTTQWTKPDRARWKVLSTRVSSFSRKLGPLSNHRAGLHWPKFNMIEAWRVSQLPDADVKIVIYRAFVEGELEAPKHLARRVHELYFDPRLADFAPRTMWSYRTPSRRRSRSSIRSRSSGRRQNSEPS